MVRSDDGDWYFEEEIEEDHDHSVNSDIPTGDTNEAGSNSIQRHKRAPIAGAGLDLVTDLVRSGKYIRSRWAPGICTQRLF